jgi:hypothetical protein
MFEMTTSMEQGSSSSNVGNVGSQPPQKVALETVTAGQTCNGRFAPLAPYIGGLTFGDIVGSVKMSGDIHEVVRTVFPESLRFTGLVYLNIVMSGNISVAPADDATTSTEPRANAEQ